MIANQFHDHFLLYPDLLLGTVQIILFLFCMCIMYTQMQVKDIQET